MPRKPYQESYLQGDDVRIKLITHEENEETSGSSASPSPVERNVLSIAGPLTISQIVNRFETETRNSITRVRVFSENKDLKIVFL